MIPHLDIHVFSAVLFVVVGILLTHAIWFNWWSAESEDAQHVTQSVSQLTTELTRQRSLADDQREAYARLREEYETTQRDWLALRQDNEHLKTRDQQRQREWAHHDAGLKKLQEFKHEAVIGLEQERHRRATAESGLRSANTTIAQLKSELAASDDRRDERPTAPELQLLQEQHNRDRSLWEERLRTQGLESAQLRQQLADASERQQAEGYTVEHSQRERDEFRLKLREEIQQRQDLEKSIAAKDRVIRQLSADSQSLQSMRAKQATFQTSREADTEQIKNLQQEIQNLQHDNQTVLAQIGALDKRLEAEQSSIRDHEKEKLDLAQSLDEQHEKVFALEAALAANSLKTRTLEDQSQTLVQLQSQHERAQTDLQQATRQLGIATAERDEFRKTSDALLERIREWELQAKQLQTENERLQKQRDEAFAKSADYHAAVGQLNAQLQTQQASLERLRRQRDGAGQSARAHREQLTALRAELESTHQQIASFDQQTQSLHKLQAQQQGFQRSLQECASRLNLASEERDRATADLDCSHAETAQLRSQLEQLETQRNQEVHRTEQQLTALRQRRHVDGDYETLDVSYPGKTRRDKQLGVLYTEEPEHKDDLQLITGITELVEQRLNDFAVYTYRQIMEWDSVAVEEFARLLAVQDRIQSDDWMGQARSLHAKYHDQAA